MAEYARVVSFEAYDAAIDAVVEEIRSADGAPPGVAAKRITVLADRTTGTLVIATRYASEEDLQAAAAVFEAMTPPDAGSMRRTSVSAYEVVLERDAS